MATSLTLCNDNISASINTFGAELINLNRLDKENVLWSMDATFWNRTAPNLFPIVGKLKNNTYHISGNDFTMTQHGFARDQMFDVLEQSNTSVTFLLKSNKETRKNYPFDFEFKVKYLLQESVLKIEYSTRNLGDSPMPYSVGGHPGFQIQKNISNYSLLFPDGINTLIRHLLDDSCFSGETEDLIVEGGLKLNEQLFERDAIVIKSPSFDQLTLIDETNSALLTVQSDNWEAIGIWTKKDAPFLCIEPWWGFADSKNTSGNFFQKDGIHILEPGQTETVSYSILVHE